MNRTELREEIKKMRFEEAYDVWWKREPTQEQATSLCGGPPFWTIVIDRFHYLNSEILFKILEDRW